MKKILKINEVETILDLDDYEYFKNESLISMIDKQKKTRIYIKGFTRMAYPLSRVIMDIYDSKLVVDHINGNTLDNRRSNLRVCTQSQNLMNSKKSSNNKSGLKGVSWHKKNKQWQVFVGVNNKRIFGGYYKCRLLAGMKYDELAIKHHGRFAKLNY